MEINTPINFRFEEVSFHKQILTMAVLVSVNKADWRIVTIISGPHKEVYELLRKIVER